jgi:hypothetical protein
MSRKSRPHHWRAHFRELLAQTPVPHAEAIPLAERWCNCWTDLIPPQLGGEAAARAVACKLAGYNADLHGYAARTLHCVHAADAFVARRGNSPLDLDLPDLRFSELVLASRGARLRSRPANDAVAELIARHRPRSSLPGHELFEVNVTGERRDIREHADVLFVASMNNYLLPMVPVAAELEARGTRCAFLLPPAASTWSNTRLIPPGVVRLCTSQFGICADSVRSLREQAEDAWRKIVGELRTRWTVGSFDLWPFVRADLKAVFESLVASTPLYARIARESVDALGARTVVGARLRRAFDIAFFEEARRAGASCTLLIHGHVASDDRRHFDDGRFAPAARVCCWGNWQREQILAKREQLDAASVVATGNPAWDRLARVRGTRSSARRRLARALGIDPRAAWVTLAAQDIADPQFEDILLAAARTRGIVLLIRPHPRQPRDAYASAAAHPARRIADQAEVLHDLLLASDAMLTHSSTTNAESLILGTPVVTVVLPQVARLERLVDLGQFGLPVVESTRSLAAELRAIARNPGAWRRRLRLGVVRAATALAGEVGHAASNVADAIDTDRARARVAA